MTNDELIRLVVNGVVISGTAIAALNVMAASVYDARQYKFKKFIKQHPNARQLRPRPLISIIIPFENDRPTITDSLTSIVENRYRKFEVVLVNAGSSDGTVEATRQFIAGRSKKQFRLLAEPAENYSAAISTAAQSAGGEAVMVIDGRTRLQESALINAVLAMNLAQVDSIGLNVKVSPENRLIGLFEQYEYLAQFQARKLSSLAHQRRGFEKGVIYLRKTQGSIYDRPRYRYASGALLLSLPSRSYGQAMRRQRQRPETAGPFNAAARVYLSAIRVVAPFLFIFFIYQAFYLRQVFLFGLAWISLIVFLSLTVLADEYASKRSKLGLIALTPMMYAPIFLASLLAPVLAFKNLVYGFAHGLKARLHLPRFFSGHKEEKIA
jgi:glycosyltransferase involved in cell wall biosynthesis